MLALERITQPQVLQELQRLQITTTAIETNDDAIRVRFEHEEESFALAVFKDSANFSVIASHWKLDDNRSAAELLSRCNQINCRSDYVKVQYVSQSHIILVAVEWIAVSASALGMVLGPYIRAIHFAGEAIMT